MIKYILATALGTVVGFVFCFFILIALIAGLGSYASQLSNKSTAKIQSGSALVLSLEEPVKEKSDEWSYVLGTFRYPTLRQITQAIDFASQDDKINGIYLNLGSTPQGWSTLKTIREALEKFKLSSKYIYAYSDAYSERSYYLASVADKIFMHPKGEFSWDGIASTSMFYKNTFEKLGVKPIIFRVGKYKSAIEPLTQTQMSDSSREQVSTLIDDIWQEVISIVVTARKLDAQDVERMAEYLEVRTAEEALDKGLIDELKLRSEIFEELLVAKTNEELKKKDFEKMVDVSRYLTAHRNELFPNQSVNLFSGTTEVESASEDLIGIINIEGAIMPGKSSDEIVGSDDVVAQIQKAKYDKNIKGVILRVNSPGGSALASDVIWSEIKKLRDLKPVYASFGDVAASGGYYVGVAAEKIYAHPNTITGSIGVYSILMDVQKGADQKLGLSFDRVVTHPFADRGSAVRNMSQQEAQFFQEDTNRVYRRFIEVVQAGREIDNYKDVHNIAQGRVWSGTQAKQIGLVDEIGNLEDAIATLADELKITDSYRAVELRSDMKFNLLFSGLISSSRLSFMPVEMKFFAEYLLKQKQQMPIMFEGDRIWAITPQWNIQ